MRFRNISAVTEIQDNRVVMDQSLPYQYMCRKAIEIQQKWEPSQGDVYITPAHKAGIHFWIEAEAPHAFRKGFAIFYRGKTIRIESRVWLPRLNQLMDLAQIPGIRFQDMTFRFHRWAGSTEDRKEHPCLHHFKSQEQLWLAFVMAIHSGKQWDGKQWITISPATA
ncbi:hypothetical protein OOT00_11890 [Desulfobotulus sp. H1]|uniref:Uncharacterized protein n=1 Tax=Desulfobotulus pelophilus TaxID=2823377 RepID=A0ABT3NB48_9BACT|nr:hypothetical protein [Desulfobotulus pelophilus]MCW7754684.1 hypothetical protein [Desulfobotulus pelophilus]